MNRAAQFSAAYAVLTAANEVGDRIGQPDRDAVPKGRPGDEGHIACLRHVASLGLEGRVGVTDIKFPQISGLPRPISGVRQVSWTEAV
uniref:hypothetical protein n=1 Tax=Streptomyces tubercidicus TaxID=47759 RepID=UPI0030E1E2FA